MDKFEIQKNIEIKSFTTLNLGGNAKFFSRIRSRDDFKAVLEFAKSKDIPIFPLGGGSNIVVNDEIPKMLWAKIENKGIEVLKETDKETYIKVYAGEIWDDFVEFAVSRNLSGIEALSLIPGTAGATPVQNVSAYGTEVSRVIEEISFYDFDDGEFKIMRPEEAKFDYRDSIFKHELKSKLVIESIVFRLSKGVPEIPDYPLVSETIERLDKNKSKLSLIRDSIIKIRKAKLPDPNVLPNVGSFFTNPIVSKDHFEKLKNEYPDIKFFDGANRYKIPAGWLIEKAGLKGYRMGNIGTSTNHALVLVNYGAVTTKELLDFASLIQDNIYAKFGISLQIEPEIV